MTPLAPVVVPLAPVTVTVTPQAAIDAYQSADSAVGGTDAGSFGSTLRRAMQGAIESGHDADAKSMQAIAGGGNITDVVTAVSKAELTLQTAVSIRDKMVAAYQDIMRMAI